MFFCQNATIWTGKLNGLEIIKGDILLQNGLIKDVGIIDNELLRRVKAEELVDIDANGAWVSPGYVPRHAQIPFQLTEMLPVGLLTCIVIWRLIPVQILPVLMTATLTTAPSCL